MDFRIRQLRCFLTLASLLHFGRTARALYMSQTTTTFQIRTLEESLGITLFERNRQKVTLTDAGRAFLPYAKRIVEDVDAAALHLERMQNPRTLRIACGSGHAGLLSSVLRRMRQRQPDVMLQLADLKTAEQMERLQTRQLDAAWMMPPLPVAGMRFDPLGEEPLLVLMADSHPLASSGVVPVAQLGDYAIICPRLEDCPLYQPFLLGALGAFNVQPQVVPVPQSPRLIAAYVAALAGVAVLPAAWVPAVPRGLRFLPFVEDVAPIQLGLATRKDDESLAVASLREIVLECAAELRLHQLTDEKLLLVASLQDA